MCMYRPKEFDKFPLIDAFISTSPPSSSRLFGGSTEKVFDSLGDVLRRNGSHVPREKQVRIDALRLAILRDLARGLRARAAGPSIFAELSGARRTRLLSSDLRRRCRVQ